MAAVAAGVAIRLEWARTAGALYLAARRAALAAG